jgi:hypothetical protein
MRYVIVLIFVMLVGCSDPKANAPTASQETKESVPAVAPEDDRIRILKQDGVKDPKLTGAVLFGCADSDSIFFNSSFAGTKNGNPIEGYICGGFFKGYTIRYK